jgi:hypothetical protein
MKVIGVEANSLQEELVSSVVRFLKDDGESRLEWGRWRVGGDGFGQGRLGESAGRDARATAGWEACGTKCQRDFIGKGALAGWGTRGALVSRVPWCVGE